jgi:hypothetical protein
MDNEAITPWWAKNRDRFILWSAAAMFGVILWQVPSKLDAMREEHRHLLTVLQIQCVHDSKDTREQRECLTLVLEAR